MRGSLRTTTFGLGGLENGKDDVVQAVYRIARIQGTQRFVQLYRGRLLDGHALLRLII